ncbi:uncharacterized protein N7477_002174 [Penicillium maclennaniae]|uniref:uncharacterized protein n=1 Tax=Penicillium maclennaniae TaxID=1343394 RepID=UPI002540911E|nr:uncharacterized protein N7477_002174 [Penicillium maclennaniae]KAJ5676541.1 hypothetical protein N7477_002174 [Penicillium maclennaniae]
MDSSTGSLRSMELRVSDDGLYAAHMRGKDLAVFWKLAAERKEIDLERLKSNGTKSIKFAPTQTYDPDGPFSTKDRRLLTHQGLSVAIWKFHPLEQLAEIQNIEPESLYVDFGGNENEVLVFHNWNTKLTIYSLSAERSTVIKSPKLAHSLGYGYRPKTRQLAILLKPETTDILTVHESQSYELVNRTVLTTIDAQGLKWSPDGKWIAVWDVASAGTKVLIFTADGQLFRTYSNASGSEDENDTGVRQIEWSPATSHNRTSQVLAVSKVNGNIELLRTRTFSSSTILSHVFQVDSTTPRIWRERSINALGDAEYTETSSSSAFNMSSDSSAGTPRSASIMAFSADGTLLATVDPTKSNVVWIWSMEGTPALTSALVHEQPVRQLAWNPSTSQLLINIVTNNLPSVRYWSPQSQPMIAKVPIKKSDSGRYEVKWLTVPDRRFLLEPSSDYIHDSPFWFGSSEEWVVGYLSEEGGRAYFKVINSIVNSP